ELPAPLRARLAAEVEEDLERRVAGPVEELNAQRRHLVVHVAGLLDAEGGAQFGPADVHVECLGLHVEKFNQRDTLPRSPPFAAGAAGLAPTHAFHALPAPNRPPSAAPQVLARTSSAGRRTAGGAPRSACRRS